MKFAYLLCLALPAAGFCQVGINTTTPAASLEIAASNPANPTGSDGILVPRVTQFGYFPTPAYGQMVFLTTQYYDDAPGFYYYDTVYNGWLPVGGRAWSLGGNANVDDTVDFIGSTNPKNIAFKRNNEPSGLISDNNTSFGYRTLSNNWYPSAFSTAFGTSALQSLQGQDNAAFGFFALSSYSAGNYNTAIGSRSMYLSASGLVNSNTGVGFMTLNKITDGENNVAIGSKSLANMAGGSNNVAIGTQAMESFSSGWTSAAPGDNNTVVGYSAMRNSTAVSDNAAVGSFAMEQSDGIHNAAVGSHAMQVGNGDDNVAFGYQSMSFRGTSSQNVAVGSKAMYRFSGLQNTVVGVETLQSDLGWGNFNTALGFRSLFGVIGASYNTAIGHEALNQLQSGDYNAALGAQAFSNSGNYSYSTAVGAGTAITADCQMRFGNAVVTSIGGTVGWTTVSDGRFKRNLREDVAGLRFITQLRPVTYDLDRKSLSDYIGSAFFEQRQSPRESGFIAQEVEMAAKKLGFEFSGIDAPKNPNDVYGLRYSQFVVPLVKAVQEQQQIIETQQREILQMQSRLQKVERSESAMLSRLSALEKKRNAN